MSCCPPNAWKFLAPDYNVAGNLQNVEGVDFYATGSSTVQAILLLPDIFGWNGGRTRTIADFFADEGFYVTVPRLMVPPQEGAIDGDGFPPSPNWGTFLADVSTYPEADLLDKVEKMVSHILARGVKKIHILSFCWGGWVASHVLAHPTLSTHFSSCAVGHPSMQLEEYAFQRSTLALIQRTSKPVIWLPAKGDSENYNEGGEWFEAVRAQHPTSATYPFPTMEHGFIPRGDLAAEGVRGEVERSLGLVLAFFNKH